MLFTLALLVLSASVAIFFSEEFYNAFKKLFEIKGIKLLLPLSIASWAVCSFDYGSIWFIFFCSLLVEGTVSFLVSIMPFQEFSVPISLIMALFVLSIVPVFLIDFIFGKRTYKGRYQYIHISSIFIFVVSAVLLLTNPFKLMWAL
jgi:hypothetical protein